MSRDSSDTQTCPSQARPSKDERKAERLRAALRENLKRRKAQARGRAETDRDGVHEIEEKTPQSGTER